MFYSNIEETVCQENFIKNIKLFINDKKVKNILDEINKKLNSVYSESKNNYTIINDFRKYYIDNYNIDILSGKSICDYIKNNQNDYKYSFEDTNEYMFLKKNSIFFKNNINKNANIEKANSIEDIYKAVIGMTEKEFNDKSVFYRPLDKKILTSQFYWDGEVYFYKSLDKINNLIKNQTNDILYIYKNTANNNIIKFMNDYIIKNLLDIYDFLNVDYMFNLEQLILIFLNKNYKKDKKLYK